jgi:hypothetical protein
MSEADFAGLAEEFGSRAFLTAEAGALLDQPAQVIGNMLAFRVRTGTTVELGGRSLRLVKAGRVRGGYHRWRFELIAAPAPVQAVDTTEVFI